jgi:myosin heavy subunit
MSLQTDIDNFIYLDDYSIDKICSVIENRFHKKKIYTYFGTVLFSINPYQYFTGSDNIYSIEKYKKNNKNEAHLFNITENIVNKIGEIKGQTIIISGESGSGKTETVKNIIHYLNYYTTNEKINLLERIEKSGLLLEQFGNAKTIRNHNSSRFGKYIQIFYNNNRQCLGMNTTTYLLEKTRLRLFRNVNNCESNFHIFETIVNNNEYLLELFANIGFVDKQMQKILNIVNSIPLLFHLTLDNITLDKIAAIAELLNINADILYKTLTEKNSDIGGETIRKIYNTCEFIEICDTFAMKLYEKLFQWIVNTLNCFFKIDIIENNKNNECTNTLGLLDIFGFENFENNSLEQLCINYTNEILQQYLNKKIIIDKIDFYASEGLHLQKNDIDNMYNNNTLELLQNIFFKIDEECFIPKGCDKTLIDKMNAEFHDNIYYHSKRLKKNSEFCIEHFAGKIDYQIEGFIKKNTDRLNINIEEIVNIIFQDEIKKKKQNNKIKMNSITNQFCNQLEQLMKTIETHEIYFIKCIKPNDSEIPLEFNYTLVKKQIEYNGVLKLIDIFKQGFPFHFEQQKFYKDYRCIFADIEKLIVKGKTRYFITDNNFKYITNLKNSIEIKSQITISKHFRGYIERIKYSSKKKAILYLSRVIFVKKCYIDLKLNLNVYKIQNKFREYINNKKNRRIASQQRIIDFIKNYHFRVNYNKQIISNNNLKSFIISYITYKRYFKYVSAYFVISKWWKNYLKRKNNYIKKNEHLENVLLNKDKKICELELKIIDLENKLKRSLHIDKSILCDRDHTIVQLKIDLELYKTTIQDRLKEKLSFIEQLETLKLENKILIRQIANMRTYNNSNWFQRLFN